MTTPADATESCHTASDFDEENPAPKAQDTTVEPNENVREGTRCDDAENSKVDVTTDLYDDADTDEDGEGPVDGVGCERGCARDRHLTMTLLSVGLLVVPILMAAEVFSFTWFIVIESFLGALYLFFVLRSNTFQYLLNISTTETVMDCMDHMYRAEPVVRWFIQCYHFETRTRQVASTDSNGNTTYTTEYYQERVNTHYARGQLVITRWCDISTPLDQQEIEAYNMTKISVKKTWVGDDGAAKQKRDFICANNLDVYYDFSETLDLEGYRARFLGFVHLDNVPALAHWGWYLASHLTVVLAVPYRMWLSSKSHKVRTAVVKQVYTT